jgi:hypothetical protein
MNSDMHNNAGHLTALGWTTFALYLVAAFLSFRAASVLARCQPSENSRIWIWLGVVLAALGVNKPLDLQTRLIELGRHIAGEQHLMARRNELYAFFFAGFMLAVIALFAGIAFRWRELIGRFGRQFPLATVGCALICAYVVIRAASITRVDLMLGWNLERTPFLWLLEAGGLVLIVQALRGVK